MLSGVVTSAFAQIDEVPSPQKKEDTYHFSISKFERQPKPPKYLMNYFEEIANKPQPSWTQVDSLYFAFKQVHLMNFEHALSIFYKLEVDTIKEPHALRLYHTTLLQTKRYEGLKVLNIFDKLVDNQIMEREKIRKRLVDVYILQKRKKWSSKDSVIFPILKDTAMYELRNSKLKLKEQLIPLAKNIDEVLRLFVILNDSRDIILSQAYEEFGDFQNKHFYITNAYLCYAISLHYNSNEGAIQKSHKIKAEMSEKNYLLPSFRKTFGKIIKNRYQFPESSNNMSSNNDSSTVNKTNVIDKHSESDKKKDYLPWLDTDLFIVFGLGLLLILVLFLLRTKKK